jgi:hypothetical protein
MALRIIAATLALVVAPPLYAQAAAPLPAAQQTGAPTTVEYYYRVKWGSLPEFVELYKRNHLPLLMDLQKQGLITNIAMEEPFTHLAGGVRWDLRVRVTYPSADDALAGSAMAKGGEEAWGRIYKDGEKFMAEENKRFGLLEDHWDVVVKAVQ